MGDTGLQWGWKRVNVAESELSESESSVERPGEAGEPGVPAGTFIGSGALFEGTLELRGDFQIDSEFRGALRTDGKVVVGTSGSVEGDIQASDVEIFGAVVGDITARRELSLRAGSRVHGGVVSACLEIERHAFFSGTTAMTEPQRQSRAHSRDASTASGPAVPRDAASFSGAPTTSS